MLLDWIKQNVRDGADIREAENLLKDLDPLKNIKSQEDALRFIDRNTVFKSALDAETSRRVERHDDRFKSEKLPELVKAEREKIMKEINPDLTPEQKRIAELEQRLQQNDREKAEQSLKASLRQKASELNYDPIRAEQLFVYGDKAVEKLQSEVDYFQSAIDKALEKKLKGQYSPKEPKRTIEDPAKLMSRADLENLSPMEKTEFFRSGGKLTD